MEVGELAPGVWRWTAGERACFYVEAVDATLLVDPVVPSDDDERFWRALDRDVARRGLPVVLLLTGAACGLDPGGFRDRYGAEVWAPGDEVPAGVRVLGHGALWLPSQRALAAGGVLVSAGGGLEVAPTADAASLRAWLELPVEHVLVARGPHVPGGSAALAAALERA